MSPLILFANQAAVEIKNARLVQALQKALDELEIRVQERTVQLTEAKAALEAVNASLQRRNAELEAALGTIKTLSGFVPVCAWCHSKIRGEDGRWVSMEQYIEEYSGAIVAHGICPDCAEKSKGQV